MDIIIHMTGQRGGWVVSTCARPVVCSVYSHTAETCMPGGL